MESSRTTSLAIIALCLGLGIGHRISSTGTSSELETVLVSRVIDGDTVELPDGRRIRYLGIDTPERGGR
jgi:endonuclease YncB( thermonuclease family)